MSHIHPRLISLGFCNHPACGSFFSSTSPSDLNRCKSSHCCCVVRLSSLQPSLGLQLFDLIVQIKMRAAVWTILVVCLSPISLEITTALRVPSGHILRSKLRSRAHSYLRWPRCVIVCGQTGLPSSLFQLVLLDPPDNYRICAFPHFPNLLVSSLS